MTTNKRSAHPATMVVNHEISKFKAADNYKRRYIALFKKIRDRSQYSSMQVNSVLCEKVYSSASVDPSCLKTSLSVNETTPNSFA